MRRRVRDAARHCASMREAAQPGARAFRVVRRRTPCSLCRWPAGPQLLLHNCVYYIILYYTILYYVGACGPDGHRRGRRFCLCGGPVRASYAEPSRGANFERDPGRGSRGPLHGQPAASGPYCWQRAAGAALGEAVDSVQGTRARDASILEKNLYLI